METGMRLLMSDGALELAFQSKLTAHQYAALLRASEKHTTCDVLGRAVVNMAKR